MNNAKTSEVTFSMIFGGVNPSEPGVTCISRLIEYIERTSHLILTWQFWLGVKSRYFPILYHPAFHPLTLLWHFFFFFSGKVVSNFFYKKRNDTKLTKKKKKTPDHNICPQFIFDSGFWIWKWDKNYMYRESFIQTYFLFVQQFRIQGLDGRVWSELMSATASFMIIGSTLIDPNPKP